MNRKLVDRIVDAVLYEGYVLYPYRPSVKNRQRWTFGGLYPAVFCSGGSDSAWNQTECLVEGSAKTELDIDVRFLHLIDRTVGAATESGESTFRPVESLRVGDTIHHAWQEAEERDVELTVPLGDIVSRPHRQKLEFPGRRWRELLRDDAAVVVGVLVREQQPIEGTIDVGAIDLGNGRFKVTVRVENRTPLEQSPNRDAALLRTLVSTHTILAVREGAFVSLLDPPELWREAAAACANVGTWPILVGAPGDTSTILSSPIILYDYPEIAPESPGNLFDGCEIDEILTLRILTLTEDETRAAAGLDGRTRDLMARTEALAREQLSRLHGTMRPVRGGSA
jgi:hydrogenase maturation protease